MDRLRVCVSLRVSVCVCLSRRGGCLCSLTGFGALDERSQELENKVNKGFNNLVRTLPKALWLTAMPQLLSRLLHPSQRVQDSLVTLLASIVAAYPDQSLWFVVPVTRSRDSARASRAKRIVQKALATAKDEYVAAVLQAGSSIVKELIRVCIQPAPQKARSMRASANMKGLLKLFPSMVAIPTQAALTTIHEDPLSSGAGFVTFHSVEDEVLLMPSLMKPKKVSFIGSDGRTYVFLCKREDSGDMRKDARLMEFANVVNRLLAKVRSARSFHPPSGLTIHIC